MAIVIYLNFNKHQFQNKHELLFLFLKKMKNSQKELLSNIGKNLRKIRESKSYTQKELAAAMQMDASQYHKLEAGKTYTVKKISVASSSTGVKLEETEELEYELCWFDIIEN